MSSRLLASATLVAAAAIAAALTHMVPRIICRWPVYFASARSIPICGAWPHGDLRETAATYRRPVVGRGSDFPSASWSALASWRSPEYVAATFGELVGVWRRPLAAEDTPGPPSGADSRSFVYWAERGHTRDGAYGMRAPLDAPAGTERVTEHVMSAADFVAGALSREQLLYCSHDLAAMGDAVAADVHPLSPYDLRSRSAQREKPTRGIVWLGAGGTVTHAHYDASHNVFVQVVGRKHFALWPPTAHSALRLYPTRHTLHRQSSWASPPRADAAGPHALGEGVVLEEGDILYLPPFYAHHVTALSNLSISVAVWSESDAAKRKDALETLPLPWEGNWSEAEQAVAATQFVRRVLVDCHAAAAYYTSSYTGPNGGRRAAEAARAALRALLASRYEPLRALPLHHQEGLLDQDGVDPKRAQALRAACTDTSEGARQRRADLHEHVAEGARKVADAVLAISPEDSFEGIASLALANYLEAIAEFVAGRGLIHEFLSTCALGKWGRAVDAGAGLMA